MVSGAPGRLEHVLSHVVMALDIEIDVVTAHHLLTMDKIVLVPVHST